MRNRPSGLIPESRLENRCMKCGLTNHTTGFCRHLKQVQCFKCNFFGQSDISGLCWNIYDQGKYALQPMKPNHLPISCSNSFDSLEYVCENCSQMICNCHSKDLIPHIYLSETGFIQNDHNSFINSCDQSCRKVQRDITHTVTE